MLREATQQLGRVSPPVARPLRKYIGTRTTTVENRWDEKAGLRRDAVRSKVIDVLEAQIKRRPAMKKISTAATRQSKKFSQPKLTIGLDRGDRSSWYCLLDEVGEMLREQKLGTTPKAMREVFGAMPRWCLSTASERRCTFHREKAGRRQSPGCRKLCRGQQAAAGRLLCLPFRRQPKQKKPERRIASS